MLREDEYFQNLTEEELWQRYCGFLDLSVDEFMRVQEDLLMEEIDLVADSVLGKKIMGGKKPGSVDEFRQTVPLTTYEDYEPYLSEQREDALAVKPVDWSHSAGRGGHFKWIPSTQEALDAAAKLHVGQIILATARRKGDIRIKPGERFVVNLPDRPYASGTLCYHTSQAFSAQIIPPLEDGEKMDFQQRIQKGFQMALRTGVDEFASISSVLVKTGERMTEEAQGIRLSPFMLHPQVLFRFIRAWLYSKLNKRPMLPRDLWRPKGIMVSGTDTAIYKDNIAYYWGKLPYETYGATEVPGIAVQNWNKKWLIPVPYLAFMEFIPEEDSIRYREDQSFEASTLLIDELEAGKIYEVILTQFYGMPLLRYRMEDLIQVVALNDDDSGVNLPQMVFHAKIGDTIDLAGLARLTERVIWQAIANTGVNYEDWSACKEYDQDKTFVRVYIELKEKREAAEIERLVDDQLKVVDPDYSDIGSYLDIQPVKVTLLSPGTFDRYYLEKESEGADLAHLKPPHVNAPETVLDQLRQLSEKM